jgi:DNA polymerase-3 subunit delta'
VAFFFPDALALLQRAHQQNRLAHAYLITGPEGSGKRQLVSELCALLVTGSGNSLARPDAHLLEPESKSRRIRTEAVRELERELQMRPRQGHHKVGVIFDADRLMESAANAFLKTLEEPPAHSYLFLVTALADQLLDTIVSRCIEVPLLPREKTGPTGLQAKVLTMLHSFGAPDAPHLHEIFGLARQFQELLAQAKQIIQDETEAALKREEPLFKQVGNKDALEEREAYYKALTESRYLGERTRLLNVIDEWWADVLRQRTSPAENASASPPLDHPAFAKTTRALADRFTASQLLGKVEALEALRENLNRNVQEQLAIEIAFLDTFAAAS